MRFLWLTFKILCAIMDGGKEGSPMKQHRLPVQMTLCAVFAAILCLCSPIAVPVGPIPVTLSVFAVLLCAVVLEWRAALVSVAVYLLLGLFLPVFAGGMTGISAFPGLTGGYIWSYPLMVLTVRGLQALVCRLAGSSGRRKARVEYFAALLGCVAALPVCYLCGAVQYALLAQTDLWRAAAVCVLPFLPVDLCKAAAASLLGVTVRNVIQKL